MLLPSEEKPLTNKSVRQPSITHPTPRMVQFCGKAIVRVDPKNRGVGLCPLNELQGNDFMVGQKFSFLVVY